MKKTLLVGLDAACWAYVQPLLRAGRMPTLQRLIETGVAGTLQSTLPALTPVAWSSIITGKNPGKHGVFDMMGRRPGSYQLTLANSQSRHGTPFWQRLNQAGLRVGLVNIPFTHPPTPVDGFQVCGLGTPLSASEIAYPAEAQSWIREHFDGFEPVVRPRLSRRGTPADVLAGEIAHQARFIQIAGDLAEKYQVQVLVINLMLTDHANHKMPDMSQVEEAYCRSDADVGRLLNRFQPDNVMLISDHGSRRLQGNFLLHAWLRQQGYTAWLPRNRAGRDDAFNWVLMQWLGNGRPPAGLPQAALRRLLCWAVPALPELLARPLWRKLESQIALARDHVRWSEQLDYARSSLFPGNRSSGLVYYNLIGREPQGTVSPAGSATLTAELVAKLGELVDPDGRPVVKAAYTPDQLYEGPNKANAPDLVLDTYDSPWNSITPYRYEIGAKPAFGRYFVDAPKSYGWHSRDGLFVFAGQDFVRGNAAHDWHVMDVPATLLHLHGVAIPDDFDGRVAAETISPHFLDDHPIRYQPGDAMSLSSLPETGLDEDESATVLNHLRSLGYVD